MGFSWTLGYTGFVGIVAFLALIVGGVYIARRFLKLHFIPNIPFVTPQLAGITALALVVLVGLPFVAPDQAKSIGGSGSVTGEAITATSAADAGVVCNRPQGGNTASLLLAVENVDNPADAYLASAVSVVKGDGTIDQTGNTNAGATLSYVTLAVTPCETGTVYITGNSSKQIPYNSLQPQTSVTTDGSLQTTMNIEPLNFNTGATLLANGSIPASGVCPSGANNDRCGAPTSNNGAAANTSVIMTNQTLGSGGSVNFKFTLAAVTANSRYGAFDEAGTNGEGVIFSVYLTDLTAMSANKGLTLGGIDGGVALREITCPSDVSANRRANKCWVSNSLKSGFTYTGTGTFNCDLGDCAPQDYADFCIDDLQWVKDTDGKFKKIAFLLDGTNVGAGGTCMRAFFN